MFRDKKKSRYIMYIGMNNMYKHVCVWFDLSVAIKLYKMTQNRAIQRIFHVGCQYPGEKRN